MKAFCIKTFKNKGYQGWLYRMILVVLAKYLGSMYLSLGLKYICEA